MRNYELIKAIYKRCPDVNDGVHYTTDQYFDRCQDIIDMIEAHRPAIAEGQKEFTPKGKQRYK